jgi:hypothetical protein
MKPNSEILKKWNMLLYKEGLDVIIPKKPNKAKKIRQKVSRDKVEKQAEQKQRKFAQDRYWLDQLEQEARRRMKQELSRDKRLRKKLIVKIIKKQRCGPK